MAARGIRGASTTALVTTALVVLLFATHGWMTVPAQRDVDVNARAPFGVRGSQHQDGNRPTGSRAEWVDAPSGQAMTEARWLASEFALACEAPEPIVSCTGGSCVAAILLEFPYRILSGLRTIAAARVELPNNGAARTRGGCGRRAVL